MLSGAKASLRWHHYSAAAIEGYVVTWAKDRTKWQLTATVVLSDAFKCAQRPLTFVVQRPTFEWHWTLRTFHVDNHCLKADLEPPVEVRRAPYRRPVDDNSIETGATADVVWGYYQAAHVTDYEVARGLDGQWVVTGTLARMDPFTCQQRPLDFVATYRGARTRWRIVAHETRQDQFRASLGAPEV